jgi:hypothetical protein
MIEQWYEVRVDGEKVAAYAPAPSKMEGCPFLREEALGESLAKAHKLLENTRHDLYKDKVLSIVACRDRNPSRYAELVVHEEHPTVFEDEVPNGCVEPLPAELFMKEVE